jgi:hypothetical protein
MPHYSGGISFRYRMVHCIQSILRRVATTLTTQELELIRRRQRETRRQQEYLLRLPESSPILGQQERKLAG